MFNLTKKTVFVIINYNKKGVYMFENIKVEQFINTTNPSKGGSFGTWSKSAGFDRETEFLINGGGLSGAGIISNLIRGNYEEKSIGERVLKPNAKPNIFGKFREKDYEYKDKVIRGKIEVVAESNGEPLSLQGDYRNSPEQAPFRIGKTKLGDGRTVVVRVSAIGTVYHNIDTRNGNYFCHGLVFPAGITPTDEQIMQIDFLKGLPPYEWSKESFKINPLLPSAVPTKQKAKEVTPNATSTKKVVPPMVFTRAEQLREWKQERNTLSSIYNPERRDDVIVYKITELNRKIDRANTYIRQTLSSFSLDEISETVKLRQEKMKLDAELKAMESHTAYDEASVKKSKEYIATNDILFVAKNLKREK